MSKQQDIVPEVVQLVADCGVSVGLILGGSVGQGQERPDSDLDFFGVAQAPCQPALPGFTVISEKNGSRLFEQKESEFPVHVACWTTASLDEVLRDRAYMLYPLLIGQVVLDPGQIATRYQARIKQYFEARPSLEKAWKQQLQDLRSAKTGHLRELAFPEWSDFMRHIEATFSEELAK